MLACFIFHLAREIKFETHFPDVRSEGGLSVPGPNSLRQEIHGSKCELFNPVRSTGQRSKVEFQAFAAGDSPIRSLT